MEAAGEFEHFVVCLDRVLISCVTSGDNDSTFHYVSFVVVLVPLSLNFIVALFLVCVSQVNLLRIKY